MLKNWIITNGQQNFLEPLTILTLDFEELDSIKYYLLIVDVIYSNFITVYGNIIYLKPVGKITGQKISKIFQQFILLSLADFKTV